MTEPTAATPVGTETVEQVVRAQLSKALGGRRGMVEAAVPTLAFTLVFLTTKDLRLGVALSGVLALVLLAVRLVQRSTAQFVLNSLVGIAIGAFFAWRSAQGGGDANAQALAYFLPGIIYNTAYAAFLALSVIVRWPLVGFMVGSVAGDPTEWHRDPQIVRLCGNLTWMLAAPCLVRVAVQLPLYLVGRTAADPEPIIAALGIGKVALGWPLQLLGLAGMAWLLARDHTPVSGSAATDGEPDQP